MKSKILLYVLLCILLEPTIAHSQFIDNRGTDFWLTYIPNFHIYKHQPSDIYKYSDSIYIFIVAKEPTNGTIEYYDFNSNKYTRAFSIADPNVIFTFKMPFNDFELLGFNDMAYGNWLQNQDETITKMSFHITTDAPVTVYGHNQGNKSSDAFLLLPKPALGTEYYVLTYNSDGKFYSPSGRTPSQFGIVATEDNTEVIIEPSAPTFVNGLRTQNITLNKGEVYLVQALISDDNPLTDLTGTRITSSKPIAVFAGHQRSTLPYEAFKYASNPSRDFICEQLPPVQAWGKNAFVVPFPQPQFVINYDIFRVLSAFDGTEVFINGESKGIINKGQFIEDTFSISKSITASAPILVAAYKCTSNDAGSSYLGDPLMMIIPPKEQFIDSVKIMNIQAYELQVDMQFKRVYEQHYITLVAPLTAVTTITLDGNLVSPAQFSPIPNSTYYYATISVREGQHTIKAGDKIGVYAYGYGQANSYGYVGGMYFNPYDYNPPKISSSQECFKVNVNITETSQYDSGIDSIGYVETTNNNIKYNQDPAFVRYAKTANISFELKDIFQDGEFTLFVLDSLGFVSQETYKISGFTFKHPSDNTNNFYMIRANYIPNTPNTYTIPIQNYGIFPKTIKSVQIITPLKFELQTSLPLTLLPNTIDSLVFTLDDNPTATDTIFIRIGDECFTGNYVALYFSRAECDVTQFEYPDFTNPINLNFVGNAKINGKYLQLTPAIINSVGAVWHNKTIPVVSGFKTEFSFRLREGSNNSCIDNSLPGADGLAFVVQNFIPYAIGLSGGGIGYEGIPNSLAIEFDTFSNDSTQIENYFDPNGNHIAVQTNNSGTNSSKHKPGLVLGINTNIMPLLTNGTVYYVKIIYEEKQKTLEVYFDTTKEFAEPTLKIDNFDLSQTINLERGYRAYVGFTSATGCAVEIHEILDWLVCPYPPDPVRPVENDISEANALFYPNPAEDKIFVNFEKTIAPVKFRIIDMLGNVMIDHQLENITEPIDIRPLAIGSYIVEIITTEGKIFKMLSVIR